MTFESMNFHFFPLSGIDSFDEKVCRNCWNRSWDFGEL